MADKFSSLSPYHFAYNNPTGFTDPSGAKPWSQDYAESYFGSDYGTRNSYAKAIAHGQLMDFVGGAGEGWNYVGYYDLDGGGYGFGELGKLGIWGQGWSPKNSYGGGGGGGETHPSDETFEVSFEKEEADRKPGKQWWYVETDDGEYLYWDRSFEKIDGWYRAELRVDETQKPDQTLRDAGHNKDSWFNALGVGYGFFQTVSEFALKSRPAGMSANTWVQTLSTGKTVVKGMAGIGLVITYADYATSDKVSSAHILDAAAGIIGLIPGGTGINAVYFIGNAISIMSTGNSFGQHLDNYIDSKIFSGFVKLN